MAWRGHFTAHMPQLRHSSSSIAERLSVTLAAPEGQTFSQMPQPMQDTSQAARAALPGSRLEHMTTMGLAPS